jgi:hypothetical protein
MMPHNSTLSWYQAEHNLFGDEKHVKGEEPSAKSLNVFDSYKNEYLRSFNEFNRGFSDSYSEKKGGELVSMSREFNDYKDNSTENLNGLKSASMIREHDFRSPWIPKKYAGRNMFASHIDSTIFPDKAGFEKSFFVFDYLFRKINIKCFN